MYRIESKEACNFYPRKTSELFGTGTFLAEKAAANNNTVTILIIIAAVVAFVGALAYYMKKESAGDANDYKMLKRSH